MKSIYFKGVHTINPPVLDKSQDLLIRQKTRSLVQSVLVRNNQLSTEQKMWVSAGDQIQIDDQGIENNRQFIRNLTENAGFHDYQYQSNMRLDSLVDPQKLASVVRIRVQNGLDPNPYHPPNPMPNLLNRPTQEQGLSFLA